MCSEYPIGNGGFGDVYRGVLLDCRKVAIKVIRPISADGISAEKYQKRAAKELHTWSKCKHPNVAELLGFAEFRGRLAMLSPWASKGNLPAFLASNPSVDRYLLSLNVCEGLAYLHDNNVVHGDLKGANVLVSESGVPTLTDFGNANLMESTVSFTTTASAPSYSLRWTAPEFLKETGQISRPADVYALGMTILEILTGEPPFAGVKDQLIFPTIVYKKKLPNRPETQIPTRSVSGNILWSVLASCWAREITLRPSASCVRDHMKAITPETLTYIQVVPESEDEE